MVSKGIIVAGATGYIGTQLVNALHEGGYQATCLSRHIKKNRLRCTKFLRGDITNPDIWAKELKGHDAIVNLVGIIRENPRIGAVYAKVHVEGTLNLIRAAVDAGIKRYIHISALGVDKGITPYQRTKYAAESAVKASNLNWTIFRPSMVLGRGDHIVSMLRTFMKFFRILPYFTGNTDEFNLQPVFIDDLIRGIIRSIDNPSSYGKVFEVAGPERITYKEFLNLVSRTVPGPIGLLPMPFGLAKRLFGLIEKIRISPLTSEQLELLRLGSVSDNWKEFYKFFDITPTPLDNYLGV